MAIGSPKFTPVFGPFAKTELFVGAGMGYHSNDARGAVITEVPGDPTTPQGASPLLVRSRGAEAGIRTKAIPDLDSSVSFFYLRQNSEIVFRRRHRRNHAGAAQPAHRHRIHQRLSPGSWVHVDADLALSRARFLGLRHGAGGALSIARRISAGADRQRARQLRLQCAVDGGFGRHHARRKDRLVRRRCAGAIISSRPLTEDGAFQSPPISIFNGAVGYRFDNGWRIQLDALNLLNSTTDQVDLCLRLAAQDRQPLHAVLSGADRAGGGVPERRDGLCAAPDRAAGVPAHARPGRLRQHRHSGHGRRVAAVRSRPMSRRRRMYDWAGFHIGAHVNEASVATVAAAPSTARPALICRPSIRLVELARRHPGRLRRHVAVPRRHRRSRPTSPPAAAGRHDHRPVRHRVDYA